MKSIRIILLLTILTLLSVNVSASNAVEGKQPSAEETSAIRQQIGLDLTMPDFNTKKIDARIIGSRLAQMLNLLHNTRDFFYCGCLSKIVAEQNPGLLYLKIEDVKVKRIKKNGNTLDIMIDLSLDADEKSQDTCHLPIRFVDGVSDSIATNELFCYLSRYM